MITRGRLIAFILSVLAVGCAAAGLSACSTSQPSAVRPPTLTPSQGPATTTTRSPSPSPSGAGDAAWARVPKKARAHTYAAAQAFAEFYTEQVNRAWQRADADLIRPYATDHCKTCRNFVDTSQGLRDRGQHYAAAPFVLKGSAWFPESHDDTAVVHVAIHQRATSIVDSRQRVIRAVPADQAEFAFDIRWLAEHWHVNAIRLVVAK